MIWGNRKEEKKNDRNDGNRKRKKGDEKRDKEEAKRDEMLNWKNNQIEKKEIINRGIIEKTGKVKKLK